MTLYKSLRLADNFDSTAKLWELIMVTRFMAVGALSFLTSGLLLGPQVAYASQVSCSQIFSAKIFLQDQEISTQRALLRKKIEDFMMEYPSRVKMIANVKFDYSATPYDATEPKRFVGNRNLLVISLHDMRFDDRDSLKAKLLEAVSGESISHPLGSGAGHLYSRVGKEVYDYFPTYRKSDYSTSYGDRLEPVVLLKSQELAKLKTYVTNMYKLRDQALGPGNYDGTTSSVGKLDDNRPLCGIGHNCTSWMTTAPIGENGERYFQLLGGDFAKDQYAVNPGWLLLYLATEADPQRVPYMIYFTQQPVDSIKIDTLEWNFNPI